MKKISYEYDDFLTDAPYKELCLYLGKSNYPAIAENMKERAAEVGFNLHDFDKLYEKYRNKSSDDDEEEMNVTAFTHQPLELKCGKYECFGDRIKLNKKVICYTPVMPVKVLRDIETTGGGIMYEVAYFVRSKWHTDIFSSHILLESKNVVRLNEYGINATSENAKNLVRYFDALINLNKDVLEVVECLNRLGFANIKKYGLSEFSPYSDNVIYSNAIKEGNAEIFKSMHECGDYETWLNEARKCRKFSLETRLTLAASFASVLLEYLSCQPFFVHIWSPTSGSGKSVALMLAVSVWADPDLIHGKYVQNADYTAASGERIAGFLKNLPFCIDELQLSKSTDGTKVDIYALAQGSSQPKASRENPLSIKERFTWCTCFITTGETAIIQKNNVGAGAFNRLLDIKCQPNKPVVEDGVETAEILKENYGFAGQKFLKIIEDEKIAKEDIKEAYKLNRKDFAKLGVASKNINVGAAMLVADTVASMYLFKDVSKDGVQLLTPRDILPFLHGEDEISIGKRGYEWFVDMVNINISKFDNDYEGKNGLSDSKELYGVIKEVNEKKCACIFSTIFNRECERSGYDSKALIESLKVENLMFRDVKAKKNSMNVRTVRFGKPKKFYVIVIE